MYRVCGIETPKFENALRNAIRFNVPTIIKRTYAKTQCGTQMVGDVELIELGELNEEDKMRYWGNSKSVKS